MVGVLELASRRIVPFGLSIVLDPASLDGRGDELDPAFPGDPRVDKEGILSEADLRASLEVWGESTPTREFLFASDTAEGLVLAAERYNKSDTVNLGSG